MISSRCHRKPSRSRRTRSRVAFEQFPGYGTIAEDDDDNEVALVADEGEDDYLLA